MDINIDMNMDINMDINDAAVYSTLIHLIATISLAPRRTRFMTSSKDVPLGTFGYGFELEGSNSRSEEKRPELVGS